VIDVDAESLGGELQGDGGELEDRTLGRELDGEFDGTVGGSYDDPLSGVVAAHDHHTPRGERDGFVDDMGGREHVERHRVG
jgi:hypothetical protein